MGIMEIATAIGVLVGILAGLAQVLDYLEKRRVKRRIPQKLNTPQSIATSYDKKQLNHKRQDLGEAIDVSIFYGREKELATLEQWIINDLCRLVAILGMGGIGKTALSVKLIDKIKDRFDYVIWRSLRNAPPVQEILSDFIKFLSDQKTFDLPDSLDGRISLLMEFLRQRRCLLILDNIETILQVGDHAGHYREQYEGFGQLFQRVGQTYHQSCMVLTSREKPKEFDPLEGNTSPIRSLQLTGLGQTEAREILNDKSLFGTENIWIDLIYRYAGNPLALKLVAATIHDLFRGDISRFLAQGTTIFGDVRDLLEKQFGRLSDLEKEIMYCLAIDREFVDLENLRSDIVYSPSYRELFESIDSLRRRSLIERSEAAALFTLQPVVMEYLTDRLIEQVCREITSGRISLLNSHALMKAVAKDYVRNSQIRTIIKPLIDWLLKTLNQESVETLLKRILSNWREQTHLQRGYVAGNVINFLVNLPSDLCGYDFSYLTVWQAYLQNINLRDVNFAYSNFAKSVFTESFGVIMKVAFSPDGNLLGNGSLFPSY